MTPTQALEFASVRLFADRATAVSPGFSVNDQTVAPVIEICRRLDGLPLAIELAAARLRTLPVDVVAVRLIDRFRLLTGGSRTAVPRHQTLRSVVAWSWELLTSAERHLAEALAVFHGGVTVESAMSVSDVDADSTLELLTALADKSILQPVGQVMRWRMLETLREYGAEQLSLQGRTDSTRAAHAAYFCTLAEQAEPRLRGHEQMEYVRILGAERDNLSAAMRFSVDRADVRTAVRFAAALGWYWHLVGGEAEAAGWCSQILELPGSEQEPGFDISVVGWAFAIVGLGEIDQHRARARHFAETAAKGDLTSGHPLLALIEPGLALMLGDEEGAKRAIERHLQHTDPWARASLHLIRGLIAENAGDLPAVRTSSSAALKGFREAGDRWGVAMSLANSASVCVIDGELEEAVKQFREAVDLLRELGSADDISYLLMRCSIAQERNGDQAGASAALREARDLAEQRGSSSLIVMTEFALGQQLYEQDPVAGRQFVVEAIRRTDTAPNVAPQALASMHSALGGINTVEGRFDDALVSLATAWKLAIDSHDMPVVALAGVKIAELACAQAEPALAARLLGAADAIRGAPDQSDPESAALIAKTIAAIGPAAEIELDAGRRMPQKDALILLESQLTRV